MGKITVYIVQGDPRDHHGEILLTTTDKSKALTLCATLIKRWNKPTDSGYLSSVENKIQSDYKNLSQAKFLNIYLGSAWITTPQLIKKIVTI